MGTATDSASAGRNTVLEQRVLVGSVGVSSGQWIKRESMEGIEGKGWKELGEGVATRMDGRRDYLCLIEKGEDKDSKQQCIVYRVNDDVSYLHTKTF